MILSSYLTISDIFLLEDWRPLGRLSVASDRMRFVTSIVVILRQIYDNLEVNRGENNVMYPQVQFSEWAPPGM
jgi:hypothetical protein